MGVCDRVVVAKTAVVVFVPTLFSFKTVAVMDILHAVFFFLIEHEFFSYRVEAVVINSICQIVIKMDICSKKFLLRTAAVMDICSKEFLLRTAAIKDICGKKFLLRTAALINVYDKILKTVIMLNKRQQPDL